MAVMEGSLSKWTNVMKGWQYRWFVLDDNSGLLTYYTSKEKMMRGARRGCVRLRGAIIGIDDEDDSTFTITVDHKTFHFQARDADEREKWIRGLEDTIFRHGSRSVWDHQRPSPTIKDFDNKVSEADAYLQIMIDQTKELDEKIKGMTDGSDDKAKCQLILEHANAMLDNIKHSIVVLQIAKNTAHPINGIYQPNLLSSITTTDATTQQILTVVPPIIGDPIIQQGIELGSECLENTNNKNRRRLSRTMMNSTTSLGVPHVSYSSSEGEDDFFDANDSPFTTGGQPSPSSCSINRSFDNNDTLQQQQQQQRTSVQQPNRQQTTSNLSTSTVVHRTPSIKNKKQQQQINSSSSGSILSASTQYSTNFEHFDYDALYEDSDEPDDDMEIHGSVIRHLLSQVKIGMDLTKVVLPTFILERRSLLEMYADYFAHPDIFVRIADLKDPKDRMVQVVRWYLSSYHAGRKSVVAKKPYNPILGEIFRCHWEFPVVSTDYDTTTDTTTKKNDDNVDDDDDDVEVTDDGPVPWCKKNQLSFIAEQVSHHPPISAFYAEHYNKRISFNAHVYTKSKFLGLSVCVYNIGQGIVTVLDHDEEYVLTFPNGYGRSILTVPWIELGGTVQITCQKTGYSSNIEFITKPFYGNKKNRICAEVFGPDDGKKSFLTITGEWNGIMEAKWTTNNSDNNNSSDESEIFLDVNVLEIIKKQVKPISQQDDNESRKLWKEVTAGLKFNDIDKATSAKQTLEQKQRDEAKDRKDFGVEWQTKLFTKCGEDSWMYNKPLRQRLIETLPSSSSATSNN